MKTLCLCLIFFSFGLMAETPSGIISKLRGTVLFEGQKLSVGDAINKVGKIETQDKSYVQIKVEKWKNHISIGPNSKMELNFNDDKAYTLESGTCRWKTYLKGEPKGKIFTKSVSMGVRGTDFFLKQTQLLGETEIIMFDGEVLMENLNDKTNTALIKKGQWGGIGGRFGQKIAPVLDLPQVILESTEKSLE